MDFTQIEKVLSEVFLLGGARNGTWQTGAVPVRQTEGGGRCGESTSKVLFATLFDFCVSCELKWVVWK